eukprot:CAMPEP_0202706162 /NCGR_PEP_ID=MMETSP1385-20130828/18620_1 /ASSEMBLY_ACC=CAM_ASM_000861 /TAXON_ID=933848 /ORGANISM="Elphidium margaritaceum" /LENGTH=359 /DNA_ID=CAMNT_0049364569 /DNA_START=200 /DNA_END=1279 /DNA_ORIENTATION=-
MKRRNFNAEKLLFDAQYTEKYSNDPLFSTAPSTKPAAFVRWVLACKFIIASQLKLSTYQILGMQRNKIPSNMHFYVDKQQNLCALISHSQTDKVSTEIIAHCNRIETSVVQTYIDRQSYASRSNTLDDFFTHQFPNAKINSSNACEKNERENERVEDGDDLCDDLISIVRIPMSYYKFHIESSFYELCCRVASHLHSHNLWLNPLFQVFFQNIANFDCFQSTVPMVPLKGSLCAMFCQFALGIDDVERKESNAVTLSNREFVAFLAVFDCWRMMQYKRECRKTVFKCWSQRRDTDMNVMHIVLEFADVDEMTIEKIIAYIDAFNTQSGNYDVYLNELQSQIPNLHKFIHAFTISQPGHV